MKYLIHKALLSIMISILHWVQLVHQTRLLPSGICGHTVISRGSMSISVVMSMMIVLSQGSSSVGSMSSESSADSLWLAGKSVSALFTSAKAASLPLELAHGYRWELGGSVMLGLILVDFVDGDGGVNDRRLNGLLLDDRLDVLMYMMMDVLACDDWCR